MSYDYGPPPPPYGQPYGQPAGPPPNNYLVPAILTIFCCWPLAIPAIVFAAQVNSKYNAGDYAGAAESSKRARTFALTAFILGLVANVIYLAVFFSNR